MFYRCEVRTIEDNETRSGKNEMINKLVNNLPALRAKLDITQKEFADIIGIGRQTLLSIENRRARMRWDTFLAIVVVFSTSEATCDYIRFLGIHIETVEKLINSEIIERKGGVQMKFEKLWTDYDAKYDRVRSICLLPVGLKGTICPKCGSKEVTGAIITSTAVENDPNILCKDCGYWRE